MLGGGGAPAAAAIRGGNKCRERNRRRTERGAPLGARKRNGESRGEGETAAEAESKCWEEAVASERRATAARLFGGASQAGNGDSRGEGETAVKAESKC